MPDSANSSVIKRLLYSAIDMLDIEGFITAGGKSSRMGVDKAWLEIGGRPLISRVISALEPVVSQISIIANSGGYEHLGYPVFGDRRPNIGPLEAIATALSHASKPRVLLVSCDMPFLTSEFLKYLVDFPDKSPIIVPEDCKKMLEPLCAIYSIKVLKTVERQIIRGHRKVSDLFEEVPTRRIRFEQFAHLGNSKMLFENINTPADYERAIKAVEGEAG